MFKIIIDGKTPDELRTNAQAFIDAFGGGTNATTEAPVGQTDLPAAPPPPVPLPSSPFPDTPPMPVDLPTRAPTPQPDMAAHVANEFGVDTKGLPWDERIHAVTQGTNKDGSWRYRRGVEPSLIAKVESELKMRVGAGVPSSPLTAAPAPALPPIPPPVAPPAPFLVPVAPPVVVTPPPVTAPQSAVVLPAAHTVETFKASLVAVLAKLVQEGKLDQGYINSLKSYFKVDQIWQLNDDQAAEMFKNFCDHGLLKKAE